MDLGGLLASQPSLAGELWATTRTGEKECSASQGKTPEIFLGSEGIAHPMHK